MQYTEDWHHNVFGLDVWLCLYSIIFDIHSIAVIYHINSMLAQIAFTHARGCSAICVQHKLKVIELAVFWLQNSLFDDFLLIYE